MKPLIFTLILTALISLNFAAWSDEKPIGFPNLKALRDWVEKGQGHLGGSVEVVSFGTNHIAIARRSFTSGVESSDFWAFISRGKRWEEALRLGPYWSRRINYKQSGDWVAVTLISYDSKDQEVVRFSISGLSLQYPEGLKRADPNGATTNQTSSAAGTRR